VPSTTQPPFRCGTGHLTRNLLAVNLISVA
jgi:hypothetical protein